MSGFQEQLARAKGNSLQNAEAELSLLVNLVADNRLIDLVADHMRAADFAIPIHREIFARMLLMVADKKMVDERTLTPFLEVEEDWPRVKRVLAGAEFNAGPRSQTRGYVDHLVSLSSRRRLVAGLQDVAVSAADLTVEHDELVANADEAITALAEGREDRRQDTAGNHAAKVIESFGKPVVGVRCGIIGSLDDALGVLRPSNLAVVGGRPGMGKTALVSSYALGASMRGHSTLIFSLEMSGEELTSRMLADLTCTPAGGVLMEHVRDRNVSAADLPQIIAAQERLDQLGLEINETPGLTIQKLTREARTHKRRLQAKGKRLELVIVDYLQLMTPSRKGLSLYENATEVSRGLKDLAKAEDLVVMAVSQLSREVEKREDKRPMPSDLRDSGQIEQDADVILFLYREEEYLRKIEPDDPHSQKYERWRTDMDAVRNKVEFIVPKRRHGPTGRAIGYFFGDRSAMRGSDFYSQGAR